MQLHEVGMLIGEEKTSYKNSEGTFNEDQKVATSSSARAVNKVKTVEVSKTPL